MGTIKRKSKKIVSKYYQRKDLVNNKYMKLKLIELVGSVEALNKLSETQLPASVAFSLGKFLKSITNDIETYDKVKKEKAIQYGTPVEGDPDKVTFMENGELTENGKKYVEEMQEIENKEIELEIPEIKISDLGSVKFGAKDIIALTWLIKD